MEELDWGYIFQVLDSHKAHTLARNCDDLERGYYDGLKEMLTIIISGGYSKKISVEYNSFTGHHYVDDHEKGVIYD